MTAALTILGCFAVAGLAAWPLHRAADRWQPPANPRHHGFAAAATRTGRRREEGAVKRAWDVQVAWHSWPLQLGFHIDHTDPSITLHLPCLIVAAGRVKQPGFRKETTR